MDTLVLVDVTDAHGMMLSRQRFVLQFPGAPVVIGRDLACDVVLNDPYVAPRHAHLSLAEDGTVRLDDLGTINGLIAGDERVRQAVIAGLDGAQVQVGHSHLRLRTGADRLAPEQRDR
ncbi:MAG: FHA domain-containing protein, partial [Gammaproteobacteria bacterium]